MCGHCGCNERLIEIEKNILSENQHHANHNRDYLQTNKILAINLVSSPGSGKTTLLVNTINALKNTLPINVIEGDQQTDRDAKRIEKTGVKVIQLNTGKSCHLDAHQVGHAFENLQPEAKSLLFIENVGNLVCPALFDLGEAHKVVILSVTEGDDKPLKYPHMFDQASLMIINKMDLLPYVDFNLKQCEQFARQINPHIEIIHTAANTGIQPWLQWLTSTQQNAYALI